MIATMLAMLNLCTNVRMATELSTKRRSFIGQTPTAGPLFCSATACEWTSVCEQQEDVYVEYKKYQRASEGECV